MGINGLQKNICLLEWSTVCFDGRIQVQHHSSWHWGTLPIAFEVRYEFISYFSLSMHTHAICSIFSALKHPMNRCTYWMWDMNLFYTLFLSLHSNCISCMLFEVYFQLWTIQWIDAHTGGEAWIHFIPYSFHCTQIVYHACYLQYTFSSEPSSE